MAHWSRFRVKTRIIVRSQERNLKKDEFTAILK